MLSDETAGPDLVHRLPEFSVFPPESALTFSNASVFEDSSMALKSEPMTSEIADQLPAITETVTSHNDGSELVVSEFPASQPADVDTLAVNSGNLDGEAEPRSVDIYEQQPNGSELVGLQSFDHETRSSMYNNETLHQNTEFVKMDHMNDEALSSDLEQQLQVGLELVGMQPVDVVDSETRPSKRAKRKSEVWKHFKIETVDLGPPVVRKAVCMVCNQAFSYRTGPKVNGTSHLKRHIAKGSCPLSLDQQESKRLTLNPLNDAETHPGSMEINGTRKRRRKISNVTSLVFDQGQCRLDIARMIIMHEYPLHMVDHPGLVSFVRHLQPRFNMANFNTVEGDCVATYSKEKQNLQKLIDGIPGRISLALDVRKSIETTGYVFLHGQFIDHEWKMQRRLLNVVVEPFPESDTVLSHAVSTCLSSWNLDHKLCSVTLNQPASDAAIANLSELLCFKNQPVACLARTLSDMARDLLAAGGGAVAKIRSSVKYVKACDTREEKFLELKRQLQVSSDRTLVLDKATRWDTTYHMLVAACALKDVFSCLDVCYPENKGAPTMEDWKQAEIVCSYLELLFETAGFFVSRIPPSTDVFFQKVWKIKMKLARDAASEDSFVRNVSASLQDGFDKYWNESQVLLAVALAMDPRYKMKLVEFSFKKHFGEDEAPGYIREVDEAVHERFLEYAEDGIEEINQRVGVGMSDFDLYMMEMTRKQAKSELDRYLSESLLPRVDDDFDVLGWWKMNEVKYPALSNMARDVLSIPLSSVGPDYVFDACARDMDEERSSLKPETMEALTCAKDWLQSGV